MRTAAFVTLLAAVAFGPIARQGPAERTAWIQPVPPFHLIGNIYERSFATLRALPSDVFLAPHPGFFDLDGKLKKMKAGGSSPFVDPAELRRFVEGSERSFRAELKKQQSRR